jgi:pimeloyl-ACP methyl ester carboxylesterase
MSTQARDGEYIDAGGLRTYYEVTGEGDPLVLLHGGMCTIETLDGLTAELASNHRVFRLSETMGPHLDAAVAAARS